MRSTQANAVEKSGACAMRRPIPAIMLGPRLAAALSEQRRALAAAAFAFALLGAATLWMWSSALDETASAARERFDFRVGEIEFAIRQRMMAYEQILRGGVGLIAASSEVRREEWRAYVDTLAIERNYPGIQGIGFAVAVAPEARAIHVDAVRAEGFPEYALRPEGERADYTAILYLEPFDWRNQRAFGYDMFSEPVRRAAMMRARDTGLASLSGKVQLVQETEQGVQSGFLMYLPVYRPGVAHATVEARRAALAGYVYAPFRMNDLMQGILSAGAARDIDLHIHDGVGKAPQSLLYDSEPEFVEQPIASAFSTVSVVELNGRPWTLRFRTLPAFDSAIDAQKSRLILIGGLVISALFAAFVWSSSLNRHRAREVALANRGLRDEIAARTQLAGELERAKNAAEVANEAKSAFLASVSHELRTPLTLILAPLDQLLAAATLPPHRREQLVRVHRNALVLLNRVNDLLDFAKAEAGKFHVCWEHFDPSEVVRPIAEDAAVVAASRGCALTCRIDPGLVSVCGDRSHLQKIVLNLVDNALKFTPTGGRIGIDVAGIGAQWFRLEVTDSGIGIPAAEQSQLFVRFQQLDRSATRQYGGTGIGLALVKELAELMGGRVGVDSAPGSGSRFHVHLPRAGGVRAADPSGLVGPRLAAGDDGQAALRRARFAVGEPAPSPAGCTARRTAAWHASAPCVLVADDHSDMRDYIIQVLGDEYRIVAAEDGAAAWTLLQEHAVDLVVSDVMMPNVDGLELTKRIKADGRLAHLPVILVTALGSPDACVYGLDGGADDYVAKPFAARELRARVRAALRLGTVQAQLREKARQAAMATVATGVLHNLGNALVGVNVSSGIIEQKLQRSRVGKLHQLARLLQSRAGTEAELEPTPGDAELAAYIAALAEHLGRERDDLRDEVAALRRCTAHAAGVVAAQQRFASSSRMLNERIAVDKLVEMAIELGCSAFNMDSIVIERDYGCCTAVEVDRHLALQILLNLLSNACHALQAVPDDSRRIGVHTAATGSRVRVEVRDNGVGIDPAALALLFDQGFTTRSDGHGHGLHSSANWAHELGGSLTCRSAGPGRGACFTLDLPTSTHPDNPSPSSAPPSATAVA